MRIIPLVAAAAMLPTAVVAPAQEPERAYYSHWLEAQDALRGFANAGVSQANHGDRRSAYRREAKRHADALKALVGLPPADAAYYHWRILPLHERVQGAMQSIVRGMETGDTAATSAGWSAFSDALKALNREVRELK
jgi:cytochrome c556